MEERAEKEYPLRRSFHHKKSVRGRTVLERFEEKIQKTDGCWIWIASQVSGYGQLMISKRPIRAHRLSWELYVGAIPYGLFVLHSCDNPSCVNPDHLFLGTHADNMADCGKKGRAKVKAKGRPCEQNANAKLTREQAISIKNDVRMTKDITVEYGIHATTVQRIRSNKRWKELE